MNEERTNRHLHVVDPCPKRWEELAGGQAKRFCDQCQMHVYNSAALTRTEAHALARETPERLCMRLVQDADGRTLFRDTPKAAPEQTPSPWISLSRWALAAGAGLLSACQGRTGEAPRTPGDAALGTGSQGHGADSGAGQIQDPDPGTTTEFQTVLGSIGVIEIQGEVVLEPCGTDSTQESSQDSVGTATGDKVEPRALLGRVALDRGNSADPAGTVD